MESLNNRECNDMLYHTAYPHVLRIYRGNECTVMTSSTLHATQGMSQFSQPVYIYYTYTIHHILYYYNIYIISIYQSINLYLSKQYMF